MMRTFTKALVALAVVAVSAGTVAGSAAQGGDVPSRTKRVSCKTTGKTVIADRDGRVFQQQSGRLADFYWACLYSSGRAYLLDKEPFLTNVRLERRRVAYTVVTCEINNCEGDYLAIRNLSTGSLRRLDLPAHSAPNGIFDGDLELTTSGTAVFIHSRGGVPGANPGPGVFSFRHDAAEQLDAGPVDRRSLALEGQRAYWTRSGQAASALVR